MSEALRIEGVSKRYGDVQAVHPIDLSVPSASIYGLLGPNGAGKTTTIRMVMDIIKPDTGTITLLGSTDPEKRRDRIGYLPEERGIYRKMKVRELLVYFARLRRIDGREARLRADRWMERFDLTAWGDHKVESLSKGMAQKVQFIATVIHDPEAVILDEPFSGFDPINVDLVKDIILELRRAGTTIILSTHQMETVEKLCDSICLINKGKKLLDGPLQVVKSERGTKRIQIEYQGSATFFQDPRLVETYDNTGRFVEMLPAPGVSSQQILEAAMREVVISRFQLMEPSLHRIFVETVQAGGGEA
jgi:ABC-2 type transport system ATP-binding protein